MPQELIDRAIALDIPAVAITDRDTLAGSASFFLYGEKRGIQTIVGSTLTMEDGSCLTLLAETDTGYSNLCQLVSAGRANAPRGKPSLAWSALQGRTDGIVCLTGGREGKVARHAHAYDLKGARAVLGQLIDLFGRTNVYVELHRQLRFGDERLTRRLAALADEMDLPYVATGNVQYLDSEDADLRAIRLSVKHRIPIDHPAFPKDENRECYLRSAEDMQALYADLPGAIERTVEIAQRCHARLPRGLGLPKYPTPEDMTSLEYLRQICLEALPSLYPDRLSEAKERLEYELTIIGRLNLQDYFLIYWAVRGFCHREDILCHIRGSGGGSIVAKATGLSVIDPLAPGIVVERFISEERGGVPDLDLDIEHNQRDRVMMYARSLFGEDHAAVVATYVLYKGKSSRRAVEFALGLKPKTLARAMDMKERGKPIPDRWQNALDQAHRLRDSINFIGRHPGGLIITARPIAEVFGIEPAVTPGDKIAEIDKSDLEDLFFPKFDFLCSRTLTACADSRDAIAKRTGRRIDFQHIDYSDYSVFDLMCTARTLGMFHIGSGAEINLLKGIQPRTIPQLSMQLAAVRPGPVVAQMVKPLVERRNGKKYNLHPLLKRALGNTYGVLIYQDQVLEIVHDVAGFSYGRAEKVRKALGKKNARQAIEEFHTKFLDGARANGVALADAEAMWKMVASFANYSFCKAHADAHAHVVFWTAYLRCYYPNEFWYGLLCNVPLGSYPARVLEAEARRTGTKFLPFDVNRSDAKPSMEKGAIRHGLGYVRGISEEKAEAIVEEREQGPFVSLVDFIRRTKLPRRLMESLILAGAFDQFGERRQLLWDLAETLDIAKRPMRMLFEMPDERATMPPMTTSERVMATFAQTGVTVDTHLTELKRDAFDRERCLRLGQLQRLPIGSKVRVGGIMADGVRMPPTAKGAGFCRLERLEVIVDVVFSAEIMAERKNRKALQSAYLVIDGELRQKGNVISIRADSVQPLAG